MIVSLQLAASSHQVHLSTKAISPACSLHANLQDRMNLSLLCNCELQDATRIAPSRFASEVDGTANNNCSCAVLCCAVQRSCALRLSAAGDA